MSDLQEIRYTITSEKINQKLRIVFFSDLHGNEFGKDNSELISKIQKNKPDLILCGGDMSVAKKEHFSKKGLTFLAEIRKTAPVYFTNGNHETELRAFKKQYEKGMKFLKAHNICILNQKRQKLNICGNEIELIGMELPLSSYRKLRKPRLNPNELISQNGTVNSDCFTVMLSHNPAFVPQYFDYGADLTLCGHYHGGIMRLWKQQILISPYGFPLPKYGYGIYEDHVAKKHVIVSSGLGDHVIPFRIHNPEEIVVIDLVPEK